MMFVHLFLPPGTSYCWRGAGRGCHVGEVGADLLLCGKAPMPSRCMMHIVSMSSLVSRVLVAAGICI
jgi:hypothetical protein